MPVDRRTVYPPTARPLLEGGPFEAGFIALHPFFAIDGFDPALAEYGTIVIHRYAHPDESVADLMGETLDSRYPGNVGPDDLAFLAKTRGRPIRCTEVSAATGISHFSALNRALFTSIRALKSEGRQVGEATLRLLSSQPRFHAHGRRDPANDGARDCRFA
jgi:hypothetical protein